MLFPNLLQDALSSPHSSVRQDHRKLRSRAPTGIHSLPVELLTAIFVLGSDFDCPYIDSPFLLKPDQEYSPAITTSFSTAVSHVSRHWRQVALRTQSLWTTIHIRERTHITRAIAIEDHIPGITLCREEIRTIFEILVPFVKFWRSFHLKICDDTCKGVARDYLTRCGAAPNLETLQLYHFEDFGTPHNLHIATYRPPVPIFSNDLPSLKNLSLIGVNLQWDSSPYLSKLSNLELALHMDNVRPPYESWESMLRSSLDMKTLSLYYSGPKEATGAAALAWSSPDNRISLTKLRELSLTDLDPDYLCNVMERFEIPNITTLTLNLRDQDFTPFVTFLTTPSEQFSTIVKPASSGTPSASDSPTTSPIHWLYKLETLVIRGLDCNPKKWAALLRACHGLRILEVDFDRVPPGFWKVVVQENERPPFSIDPKAQTSRNQCDVRHTRSMLLPRLEVFKISGASGKEITGALRHRYRYPRASDQPSEKWIVRWNESKRCNDSELDALVDKGFWTPNNDNGTQSASRVVIATFDDEEEESDEVDDDIPATDDENDEEHSTSV